MQIRCDSVTRVYERQGVWSIRALKAYERPASQLPRVVKFNLFISLICIKVAGSVFVIYPSRRKGCRRMAERRQRIIASLAQMLAKTIVASVLIASAMTGTALACQKNHYPVAPVAVNPQSMPNLTAAVTVSVLKIGKVDRNGQTRCSTNCHCQTIGCGCCFVNAASLNPISASLFLAAASIRLSPLDQSEAVSARPPPDFRPPRTFI